MDQGKISAVSLLVVILLVGSIFYPMALTYPYSETGESYAVVHESSASFNRTIAEHNISVSNATPVRDLSPNAQRTFRQAKAQPKDGDGWQRIGGVPICSDSLLFCDKPTEPPEFPVDGGFTGDAPVDYGVINADGEVYLISTASAFTLVSDDAVTGLLETLVKFLLFGSYAVFLSSVTWSHREIRSETVFSGAVYGVGLLAISYSFPYAVMLYPFSSEHILILYIVAVVLLLYKARNTMHDPDRSDDG